MATAVAFQAITKTFPGAAAPALDRISFVIEAGELITILGTSDCVNGDRILVMVAERLKATLDGRGAIYRTGGDEFALLIGMQGEMQDRAALLAMLERARDAVNLPCEVGEGTIYPSASIGVLSDVSIWNSPAVTH